MSLARLNVLIIILIVSAATFAAEEALHLDTAKVDQLKRLEPLSAGKIDVFVESRQLSEAQAAYIKKHIDAEGRLNLPATPALSRLAPEVPPSQLRAGDPELLALVKQYRHGNRSDIGRQLRQFRPKVNAVIQSAYTDPIDLPLKAALWDEVAGPANPGAVAGLAETHCAAHELARPVLIPYAKDIGGVIVRRLSRHADALEHPRQVYYTSRELRELILEIEGMIARCASVEAATGTASSRPAAAIRRSLMKTNPKPGLPR